jgi:endonuclease III
LKRRPSPGYVHSACQCRIHGEAPGSEVRMLPLAQILDRLATVYGEPSLPPRRTLFELVLLENIAYLADDERRERAFRHLQTGIGLRPAQILAASEEALLAVTGHGILPEHQTEKLRQIARLALEHFDGDLDSIRSMPLPQARRALARFPSIGEPGAEKILLLGRSHAVLGLDSNGVRALTRLGVVPEAKTYAATYRSVQAALAPYQSQGFDWLIRAHRLLRQHGQELCRRTRPRCDRCPLADNCAFFIGA